MDIGLIMQQKFPNLENGVDYYLWLNPATNTQEFGWWKNTSVPQPLAIDLQNWWIPCLQQSVIGNLSGVYMATCASGFPSNALGISHTYQSDTHAQILLSAQMEQFNQDATLAQVVWYTNQGYKIHTKAQFIQMFKDGGAFFRTQNTQFQTLCNQVIVATDEATIKAVKWTPAPFTPP
jgi:hypothetical protein